MMNGRNWSYLILIAIIITLTVLVIYFASRNKSKSCHSKDGYSTSGDSTSGDDTYNKLVPRLILQPYYFYLHTGDSDFHREAHCQQKHLQILRQVYAHASTNNTVPCR